MQELVGRLKALDAGAIETLKIVVYFDALIEGHANTEVLLRGAAVLSGCAAGFIAEGRMMRVDSSGSRSSEFSSSRKTSKSLFRPDGNNKWPSRLFGENGTAWIEREGSAHTNDAMILERLAIALSAAVERTTPSAALRRSLAILIDKESSSEARRSAVRKLQLDNSPHHRVIVVPASSNLSGLNIIGETRAGQVRITLGNSETFGELKKAGIGLRVGPNELHRSWASALVALRLTSPRSPIVDANQLGGLLVLAEAADESQQADADTQALAALFQAQPRLERLLEAAAALESLRAVAVELGLHHSTVQAKIVTVTESLGYDIRSVRGRTRLVLALALLRLTTNRFQ